MVKIFSVITIVLAIVLFPPAVLAWISNDALPGDARYPIKRKLEEGILLIASVNPTTKAWFSVERSNRRFKEAASLIRGGKEASQTLSELVQHTAMAAAEIKNIQDESQKKIYIAKLAEDIKKYDQGLTEAVQLTQSPQALVTPTKTISTPVPVLQNPSPTATQNAVSLPSPLPVQPTSSSVPSARPSSSSSVSILPSPSSSLPSTTHPSPAAAGSSLPLSSPSPVVSASSTVVAPSPTATPLPPTGGGNSGEVSSTINQLNGILNGLLKEERNVPSEGQSSDKKDSESKNSNKDDSVKDKSSNKKVNSKVED